MSDSRDLGRLKDEGVRILLARLLDDAAQVECPDCGRLVDSTDLRAGTTTCPQCGALLAEDTATNARLDSLEIHDRRRSTPDRAEVSSASPPEFDDSATRAGPAARESIAAPSRVGPYEILRTLGTGGFGRVALARDVRSGREVALKTLRREKFLDEETYRAFEERFLAEGRRTAELRHPSIVEVYEVGEDEHTGDPFIAMEPVDGGTLEQRMAREPRLTRQEAVRIVVAVASALQLAHSRRIYHCDLKPSNILLTRRGLVKVADFGLSLHEDEQWEHEGQVAGTFPYMSPEQFDGRRQYLDGRTDIWSLGVILYELLAGRRPFTGDRRQLRDAVLQRDPTPLAQRDPKIPAAYDRVFAKATRKRVEERYSTAGDFQTDLSSVLRRESLGRLGVVFTSPPALAFGVFAVILAVSLALGIDRPSKPRRSIPFFIDAHAVPGRPVPLLEHPLTELMTSRAAIPTWQQDPGAGWLTISSNTMEILELGTTRHDDYAVSMDVQQSQWSGEVGLVFSIEKPPDGARPDETELLMVCVNSTYRGPYRLERHLLKLAPAAGVLKVRSVQRISLGAIESPDVARFHTLSIDVSDRIVRRISWDGRIIDETFTGEWSKPEDFPRTTGRVGVLSFRGSPRFRNGTFTLAFEDAP